MLVFFNQILKYRSNIKINIKIKYNPYIFFPVKTSSSGRQRRVRRRPDGQRVVQRGNDSKNLLDVSGKGQNGAGVCQRCHRTPQ